MENSPKTILISGGAGFIGSHLVSKYLGEGHRIIVVDNLQTTIEPKHIKKFFNNPRFKFIKHDIIKPIKIDEKIDWIFNFACAGSYTSYQYDPVHTVQTNTVGVINMLNLAREHGARIMQSSTSEIYGDPLQSPQAESYLGNVNPLGPRACYDEGKRCAETLFMDYHREYGVDVKIIRIFNTYGPQMDINDGRAVTNFIVNALSGRDLTVYGDGSHTRSFQYIDDLLSGIDLMMKKENFVGPVNLGNPGEITMKEFAELVIKKTNSSSKIVYKETATDDPKRRCPDISLAKSKLNWGPKIPLEKGLEKTIEYFKKVEKPDKKILIFATTYYPHLGPAEKAIYELSKEIPDTEFHVITTKFKKREASFEQNGINSIHRIGFGNKFDKYLLPFLGLWKAWRLHKKNNYKFMWSVMASYAGLSALLFKFFNKKINFLLTLDSKELNKKGFKSKITAPIYNLVVRKNDFAYVYDVISGQKAKMINPDLNISVLEAGSAVFVNYIRQAHTDILNKKEHKLSRAK